MKRREINSGLNISRNMSTATFWISKNFVKDKVLCKEKVMGLNPSLEFPAWSLHVLPARA